MQHSPLWEWHPLLTHRLSCVILVSLTNCCCSTGKMEFLNYNEKCILDCCTRLAHSHSHSNIHCKLCSSVHSFIHLFIRVYAFIRLLSFDAHTHTRAYLVNKELAKLKMQTKCTIYIHLHNLCDFFLLCIHYFLFSFIINDARF